MNAPPTPQPASPEPPTWQVLATPAAVQRQALELVQAAAATALAARGVFHVVLAGGNTPRALYEAWRQVEDFDWQRTHVWWGDERAVPPDDAHSNFRMAQEALLQHVPIPESQVHRMPADVAPLEESAAQYESTLRQHLGDRGRVDVVLLGLGTDAHTASLFPGEDAILETQRWVVATPAPVIASRLTGTTVWFNAARQVLFLVVGADKQDAVARVRKSPSDIHKVPAAGIAPTDGRLTWLLDSEAAPPTLQLP